MELKDLGILQAEPGQGHPSCRPLVGLVTAPTGHPCPLQLFSEAGLQTPASLSLRAFCMGAGRKSR